MIEFVSLSLYTPIFNYLIFVLICIVAFQGNSGVLLKRSTAQFSAVWGGILVSLLIVYMGLRPISGIYFGDTANYARSFWHLQSDISQLDITTDGEWVFSSLMAVFALYSDVHYFFLCCAFIYIGALWWAMKRVFGNYYYVPLLVAMSMFTFWSYGVNGIRNGMASSLIILAMSYRKKIPIMILLCVIALGIHKSLMITVTAGALAWFIKDPKIYLKGWLLSIIVSLMTGNLVANIMISIGLGGDDRLSGYMNASDEYASSFSGTGFRFDFLLYSALPVLVGYFFILKRNYTDSFYIWIFNIYLVTNAVWIMVIRAAFSNRFAQISWFIMPLVLIYPFFKKRFWKDQNQKTGIAVLVFYLFTFYSNIIKG